MNNLEIPWTKSASSKLQEIKARYDQNGLKYHNFDHIISCYNFLNENNAEYNLELDFAVLYHDIVYDKRILKEERSAVEAMNLTENDLVAEIIMSTKTHKIERDTPDPIKWMIRADLHALSNIDSAHENYYKIMQESIDLYGISEMEFYVANCKFMRNLRETVSRNAFVDYEFKDFWKSVYNGCSFTLVRSFKYIYLQTTKNVI